jgi:hypothetical protein
MIPHQDHNALIACMTQHLKHLLEQPISRMASEQNQATIIRWATCSRQHDATSMCSTIRVCGGRGICDESPNWTKRGSYRKTGIIGRRFEEWRASLCCDRILLVATGKGTGNASDWLLSKFFFSIPGAMTANLCVRIPCVLSRNA